MKIAGSIAFVTGANRGLGKAFVKALRDAGAAKIYAAARDPSTLRDSGIVPVALDVTDEQQIAAAAARCPDTTLLFNNAGIAKFTPLLGAPTMQNSRDEMAVNYFGMLGMCRAFAPILGKSGASAIVNVLSVASWTSLPQAGSYAASKAAALTLTNAVRIELAAQGTQVLALHAGFIDTDMTAGLPVQKSSPETIVAATLAGLEAGDTEVLADARSVDIKAKLRNDPEAIEREMRGHWANYLAAKKTTPAG